jgi:dienelactone hydrolase
MSTDQTLATLFDPAPTVWGLRGDPYLWRELQTELADLRLPTSETHLIELLEQTYRRLTGVASAVGEPIFIERLSHGGMSSGHVSPEFWVRTAFPLLRQRYAALVQPAPPFQPVAFNAPDGLSITADWYPVAEARGVIVLCHRSHCNRGEYREIAPRLNALGFACLAIDQRSGMRVFGVTNETALRARALGRPTGYLDARQDIVAAVAYAYALNDHRPITLFGSSYSAALALLIATETVAVQQVIAFSPGEYLKGVRVAAHLSTLQQPVFATGAHQEFDSVREVLRYVPAERLTLFSPEVDGFHGAKTLWAMVPGHERYWQALERFLTR